MIWVLTIAVDASPLAHPHNGIGWCVKNPPRVFTSQKSSHRIFFDSDRPSQLRVPFLYNWNVRTGSLCCLVLSTACTHLLTQVWISNDRYLPFCIRRSVAPSIKTQRAQG